MDSESENESVPEVQIPEKAPKKIGRPKIPDPVDVGTTEVILTKKPKKTRVLSEEAKAKIEAGRQKALAVLTENRRKRAAAKELMKAEEADLKKQVEEKKLDKAPKVREIDDTIMTLKAELAEMKKQLQKPEKEKEEPKRKVKKIIYEDEDDDVEEVVQVVRRKAVPKKEEKPEVLEGRALLDHLFFGKK